MPFTIIRNDITKLPVDAITDRVDKLHFRSCHPVLTSDNTHYEVIAKPLGTRAARPQILEKRGQNARVPGKAGNFAITS